jgi:uncharacterized protein Veg
LEKVNDGGNCTSEQGLAAGSVDINNDIGVHVGEVEEVIKGGRKGSINRKTKW